MLYVLYLHYALFCCPSQQETKLELRDGEITDYGATTGNFNVKNVGLYLVIQTDIGLTVLWDKKMTVHIILQPQHMVSQKYWTKLNCLLLIHISRINPCYSYHHL